MKRLLCRLMLTAMVAGLQAAGDSFASVQATPTGFQVHLETAVDAAPAVVYAALSKRVGGWWNPEHTWSGRSENLSLDLRPGGCFCERLPNGGGVEHLRIVFIDPGKLIRLSGALGPLQASGLAGSMTWKVAPAAAGTSVEWTYSVGGFFEGGIETIAPVVDSVLGDQLKRLKSFVESGNPVPKTAG